MLLLKLGQVQDVFGDGALRYDGPVVVQLPERHVLEEPDDVLGNLLGH